MELLVVILIIGILAAIALPAFLNQREKAQDTEVKKALRTATTAMVVYHDGGAVVRRDSGAAADDRADAAGDAQTSRSAARSNTYTISEHSKTGTTFTVSLDALGVTTRD